jgi:O-antigen/teichoic acid export membrane protein
VKPTDQSRSQISTGQVLERARQVAAVIRPIFASDWQWIVAAQVGAVLGTFGMLKLVANLASPTEFGRFALILAVAAGVNALAFGPIIAWASRHYQEAREAGRLASYRRAAGLGWLIGVLGTATIAVVAIFTIQEVLSRAGLTTITTLMGLVAGIAVSTSDLGVAVSNAALRRRSAALFLAASRWLPLAAIAIGHIALRLTSVESYAALMIVSTALLAAMQTAMIVRDDRGAHGWTMPGDWEYVRALGSYASPYLVWGIPSYLISSGDRFLLAYFTSPAVVGIYAAMSAATTNAVGLVATAGNRVLEPTLYLISGAGANEARRAQAHELVSVTTRLMLLVSLPFVALYFAAPIPIIRVFAADEYAGFANQLWVLLLGSVMFFVSQQLILHGLIEKRPWIYLPSKILHATILVGAIAYLVPPLGLSGLASALLFAHSTQVGLVVITNRWLRR